LNAAGKRGNQWERKAGLVQSVCIGGKKEKRGILLCLPNMGDKGGGRERGSVLGSILSILSIHFRVGRKNLVIKQYNAIGGEGGKTLGKKKRGRSSII